MEKYLLENDINLICITAKSFPEGILDSFDALHKVLQSSNESIRRNLFGISYLGRDNKIIYKAAAQEAFDGEAWKLNCETYTVRKGIYNSIFISDFMSDIQSIGKAFNQLLSEPGIDMDGCCVEMYVNDKDVRCMVRLNQPI